MDLHGHTQINLRERKIGQNSDISEEPFQYFMHQVYFDVSKEVATVEVLMRVTLT